MNEDKQNDSDALSPLYQKVLQRTILSAQEAVVHSKLMIAFYKSEQDREEDKQKKGKAGLKIAELQDSQSFNERFIEYFNN